jgi:N-acetylglucosaminyldiphosphoundecaprenol N-acetyl-beta-D-mannosaminyltransferase
VPSFGHVGDYIVELAHGSSGGYVCVASVHMVMEAYDSESFRRVVNAARLVTPDGMPLVWSLRLMGITGAERVDGMSLTPVLLDEAQRRGLVVGFYGSTPEVLAAIQQRVRRLYPQLKLHYLFSPPFRPLTRSEEDQVVRDIESSKVQLLFVGLGCPKQEEWMARQRHRVSAVMVGVGAAFDVLAGVRRRAPAWMQRAGLEWLFRLGQEPRRLWRRYLYHNPRFVYYFARQLLDRQFSSSP